MQMEATSPFGVLETHIEIHISCDDILSYLRNLNFHIEQLPTQIPKANFSALFKMKIFTLLPHFVFFVVMIHAVMGQLPEVIQQSHEGIKWLYREASEGRFMYNPSRNYPNFETAGPNFLATHGKAIIDEHL